MKDLKVGDKIEFEIVKMSSGLDGKVYAEVKCDLSEEVLEIKIKDSTVKYKDYKRYLDNIKNEIGEGQSSPL